MAKDFSFDVVSEVNLQEVDNAVNQAAKEIQNRYDFKGGLCEVEFLRDEKKISLVADQEMQLKSMIEILQSKSAKRGVPLKAFKYGQPEKTFDRRIRQTVEVIQGISHEHAKEIVKQIKELKLKVQSSIQSDRIRVSGRSKDDLQSVVAMLRGANLQIPLQFINYR